MEQRQQKRKFHNNAYEQLFELRANFMNDTYGKLFKNANFRRRFCSALTALFDNQIWSERSISLLLFIDWYAFTSLNFLCHTSLTPKKMSNRPYFMHIDVKHSHHLPNPDANGKRFLLLLFLLHSISSSRVCSFFVWLLVAISYQYFVDNLRPLSSKVY